MGRGAWRGTVQGVPESQTGLSTQARTHAHQMVLEEPCFEKHVAGRETFSLSWCPEMGGRAAEEVGASDRLSCAGTGRPPSPSDHLTARSRSSPTPSTPSP